MRAALHEQERTAGSSTAKIKKLVATAGVIIGLAGTVTSLAVDDEDTKSTVAQLSSGVAGVAGIVGLLPFGSGAKEAEGAASYLRKQLPRFERRWPEDLEQPLTPEEWNQFEGDAQDISSTVRLLRN
jgi:hypothetical protein